MRGQGVGGEHRNIQIQGGHGILQPAAAITSRFRRVCDRAGVIAAHQIDLPSAEGIFLGEPQIGQGKPQPTTQAGH